MVRRIIINADDFGLCSGVNRAVAQAHTDGILTSATIMANMPTFKEAVDLAKELPKLGVGVHLNISDGRPLSMNEHIHCLLDSEGQFALSPSKLALLSMAANQIKKTIRTEFAAQIQLVIDNGIKPTHLDSHKHIHSFPSIFPIVCELAGHFKIPAVRFAFEPLEICKAPWPLPAKGGEKRSSLIRTMARINRMQCPDLLKTDILVGIAHTGKIDVHFLRAVTSYNFAAIIEVMTHPGFGEGLDPNKTRLVRQRQMELEVLCSEEAKRYFKEAGIKLVHYGQL